MIELRWIGRSACLAAALLANPVGCGPAPHPKPVPKAPVRIASLTLATDELLAGLVPADRVVGVSVLADDPAISNVVGHYPATAVRLQGTAAERLIALSPDLVCVASYNTADTLKLLERSGLSLYRNESVESIAGIEAGITSLGARVGEPERARTMIAQMEDRRRRLGDRLRGVTHRPRVLFWSAGYTSGRSTTIDDLIREAGGVNVAAELGFEGSAEITPERVVAAEPEVVLVSRWKADESQGEIASHPILRRIQAVRRGHVIGIESRYLTSISQFVLEGAERLAQALHPEQFAAEVRP